jgi:hypothetical protein
MRIENVPQDDENYYDGNRRAVYAVEKDGKYVLTHSKGWQVETFFTGMAINDVEIRVQEALEQVRKGKVSPLVVHMIKWKMDPSILAEQARFFRWQVKRHLRPEIFRKLSRSKLQKYADVFCVTVDQLDIWSES